MLRMLGVSEVFIGYPKNIAHGNGNEHNENVWSYRNLVQRLREVLKEYGIMLHEVVKTYTSKACSTCEEIHENIGIHRGLYICETHRIAINADISSVRSIARELGYNIQMLRKIRSLHIMSKGLRPLTLRWGNDLGLAVKSCP